MTWILTKVIIQGVRGVLDRSGDISLKPKSGNPRSIAIFGRNGCGKSGYADAIEYLFSSDGEVEHLGKGSADSESGGKHAISHVLAAEKGIPSQIYAEFLRLEDSKRITVTRPVIIGRADSRPQEIETILANSPAHRILRQHDLRRFVVEMAPGQKYEEFARWIGLDKTTVLLKHLTTTERTLHDTDVDREINERLQSISHYTGGAIGGYDVSAIFNFCENEVAKHSTKPPKIQNIEDITSNIQVLRQQRESLALQSDLAKKYLWRDSLTEKNLAFVEKLNPNGALANALCDAISAEKSRNSIKETAVQGVFQEVWESSEKLLANNMLSTCPVCNTRWQDTKNGSQENTLLVIRDSLSSLSNLKTAEIKYHSKHGELLDSIRNLNELLTGIRDIAKNLSLSDIETKCSGQLIIINNLIQTDESTIALEPQYHKLLETCTELGNVDILKTLQAIKLEALPKPISNIDDSISRLLGIQESLVRLHELDLQQQSIRDIEAQFGKIADRIRAEAKVVSDNAIEAIREDVLGMYKKIHPGEAIPNIFIQFDSLQKTFNVRVNFHSRDRKVPPGGYLSEAQINTIGLSLFLCSVRLFNKDFPFVFLDDIVSSYDADCRANIVDVLAEYMKGFQIILTTHDERFYNHLRGRMESENWLFERISSYDFERGPKRESDNLRPAQIDELIKDGDPKIAGNSVRQFMEEWFDDMCEKYFVYTLHRRGAREYKRTLFDYWEPFDLMLHNLTGEAGERILASNEYERFSGGLMPIINYYSHNQSNPYEWAAIGDVEYIWNAFTEFTCLFHCRNCMKLLRCDFEEHKLFCTCGKAI